MTTGLDRKSAGGSKGDPRIFAMLASIFFFFKWANIKIPMLHEDVR